MYLAMPTLGRIQDCLRLTTPEILITPTATNNSNPVILDK